MATETLAMAKKLMAKVETQRMETFTAELAFSAGAVTVCVSPLRWRKPEFPLISAARGLRTGHSRFSLNAVLLCFNAAHYLIMHEL